MNAILLAFITGLTTGGISCLAVQGGLLVSTLSHQLEQNVKETKPNSGSKPGGSYRANHKNKTRPGKATDQIINAIPILLFLSSKLIVYTALGFLLGMVGSVIQLTPTTRAILFLAIGVFLIGNALRMLNVHPIFRYFSLEPPKFLTRYIRRTSKNNVSIITPLFLGALTVFIPCGVTQSMMAVAVGTGDPWQGAALMFAFTLGTTPVFFVLAFLATSLSNRLEAWFTRIAAIIVLIVGVYSINSGLNLMGSPYAPSRIIRQAFSPVLSEGILQPTTVTPEYDFVPIEIGSPSESTESVLESAPAAEASRVEVVTPESNPATVEVALPQAATQVTETAMSVELLVLEARNNGYFPDTIHAKAGIPVTLNVVTNQTYSCSRAFVIPDLGVEEVLPETGTVSIEIPPQQPGYRMWFSCSMGMYTGEIIFDL